MIMTGKHISILLIAELCLAVTVSADGGWSYGGENGQDHWTDHYETCEGVRQSPINIDTKYTLPNPELVKFELKNYDKRIGGPLKNNGHTVVLNFDPLLNAILRGGGLGSSYQAAQLHFHWTRTDEDGGSEHTINGKQYAAEMHIVHLKKGFQGLDDVKSQEDGLAVLGVFFEVDSGDQDNEAYAPLFNAIGNITHPEMVVDIDEGPTLLSLLPSSEDYYRYMGSLTTPPCYQTVAWTVFKQPIKISQNQLMMLQNALMSAEGEEDEELGGNFRETQSLFSRMVSEYIDSDILDLATYEDSASWHYHGLHGTASWSSQYEECGFKTQSPIDIVVGDTKQLKLTDGGLQFDGYDEKLQGEFINNGHAVQLNLDEDKTKFKISGGGLNGSYLAIQLHLHWGNLNGNGILHGGSEHTVDGKRYIAEMHIVHLKEDNEDTTAPDTAAVLGVLFDVNDDTVQEENNAVDQLIAYIQQVQYTDMTASVVDGPVLSDLIPRSSGYYRYQGSLTTPPCSQVVVWTVFTKPIIITTKQFIALQRLFSVGKANTASAMSFEHREMFDDYSEETNSDEGTRKRRATDNSTIVNVEETLIRDNYRPVQPLFDRTVYIYDDVTVVEPAATPWLQIILYSLAGIAAFIVFAVIAVKCCAKDTRKYDNKRYQAGRSADTEML